jgi:nucleoside-diphosphate-sugar epimerase
MKPIAVLGASGFVGVRLVEMFHLGGREVRPIVSRPASLAPLARFKLDWRMADAANPAALAEALSGCDTLIHLATGNPGVICALTTPVYEAAARAGVRRIVFTSSTSVHGQTPAPGTTENSPLPHRHAFPYNAAKAFAEQRLRDARKSGSVELVILRPGIVWGPRSRWVVDTVRAARAGTFGWLEGGRGLINPIYVDNLVEAIDCASRAAVDGETFLLNDPAPQTWREFFTPWIEAGDLSPEKVSDAPAFAPARGLRARFEGVRTNSMIQKIAPKIPGVIKRSIKALVSALPEPPAPDPFAGLSTQAPGPAQLSEEMTALQRCQWRFPTEPATTRLGWKPPVDWPTAVERTLAWLYFADLLR